MQRTAESISQKDNTNSYILIDESRGWIKILNHFSSIFIKNTSCTSMLWYSNYRHSVVKLSFLAKLLLSVLNKLSSRVCYDRIEG